MIVASYRPRAQPEREPAAMRGLRGVTGAGATHPRVGDLRVAALGRRSSTGRPHGGRSGPSRRTEIRTSPRPPTLLSRPCRAVWSATGPLMTVWLPSRLTCRPSNQGSSAGQGPLALGSRSAGLVPRRSRWCGPGRQVIGAGMSVIWWSGLGAVMCAVLAWSVWSGRYEGAARRASSGSATGVGLCGGIGHQDAARQLHRYTIFFGGLRWFPRSRTKDRWRRERAGQRWLNRR